MGCFPILACCLLGFDYHIIWFLFSNRLHYFLLLAIFSSSSPFSLYLDCCAWAKGLRKQPLYLHEVVIRSTYILPFPDPTCEILLGMLLLFSLWWYCFCFDHKKIGRCASFASLTNNLITFLSNITFFITSLYTYFYSYLILRLETLIGLGTKWNDLKHWLHLQSYYRMHYPSDQNAIQTFTESPRSLNPNHQTPNLLNLHILCRK